jgi:hypothetical protein
LVVTLIIARSDHNSDNRNHVHLRLFSAEAAPHKEVGNRHVRRARLPAAPRRGLVSAVFAAHRWFDVRIFTFSLSSSRIDSRWIPCWLRSASASGVC